MSQQDDWTAAPDMSIDNRTVRTDLVGRWVVWQNGTDQLSGLATKHDTDDDEYYLVADGLIHAHVWVPASQTRADPSRTETA